MIPQFKRPVQSTTNPNVQNNQINNPNMQVDKIQNPNMQNSQMNYPHIQNDQMHNQYMYNNQLNNPNMQNNQINNPINQNNLYHPGQNMGTPFYHNAPPIVPPPQQQMNMFFNNWKDILAPIKSCKIEQVFDNREFLADFALGVKVDINNKYKIYDASRNIKYFTAYENSNFFARNCFPKMCIPVNMKILSHGKEIDYPDAVIEKEGTCTFLCLNRPTIKLYDFSNNNNKELIGTIYAPFSCCRYKFDLFDKNKNKIIYMNDTCCQLSIICPLPCDPCKYSHFYLRDSKSKETVAKLTKEVPFLQLLNTDVDNYKIDFNEVTNPEWKMMLLAFALFLDYIYHDYKR